MLPSVIAERTAAETLFAGRYAVDGPLPWGGLATYYRASTEGTPLILCVLPMNVSESVPAQASFAELAQRLGAAQSRSLSRVLDAGVIDGVPYLAFEDTRGSLLSDWIHDRSLRTLEALRLTDDVLEALEAAHLQGLVHGDLTPQNVVVARNREGRLAARVIGLGILPLLRAHPEASARTAHTGSGTHAVAYMAPELFGGGAGIEPRSDLYAVGAMLHHMVTGAPRVGHEDGAGFADAPTLPDVIGRAMAKRPGQRYADPTAMRTALDWVEVESSKLTSVTSVRRRSQRAPGEVLSSSGARPIPVAPILVDEVEDRAHRRLVQLALLLVLLGVLVFSGYWFRAQANPAQTPIPLGLESAPTDVR